MNGLFQSGVFYLSQPRKAAMAGVALFALTALSGCEESREVRSSQSLSGEMLALMQEKGVAVQAPMLIRAYKKDSEFEVWKMRGDGQYVLLKTFPICRWSGQLGPKTHEGDRQSPEGYYAITPAMMNPNSAYYLSFNIGYPNAYDRAHGATGGSVMVHGICSSAGCFSMTDAQIAEIYALARESFSGGQRAIQMHSYPFHLNAQNLAKYRLDPNMAFWRELKKGADHFEATKRDVAVAVCGGHYQFDVKSADGSPLDAEAACPPLKADAEIEAQAEKIEKADAAAVAQLVAKGVRPVRLVYQDGSQHPAFAHRFPDVSRPEALTAAPIEVALDDPKSRVGVKARAARGLEVSQLAQAEVRRREEDEKQQQAQLQQAQQAKQQAEAAAAPLSSARAQGEKLAAMISSFGAKEAPVAAPEITEVAKAAPTASPASAAKIAAPAKPLVKPVAAKPAKPADKPAGDRPQAALASGQKIASAPASAGEAAAALR